MMDKNIFPELVEIPPQSGKFSYVEKCVFHERLLYQYLIKKIEGWSVKKFLDSESIDSYALYAITDFTMLFCKDLEETDSKERIGIICDKNARGYHFEFNGREVITLDKLINYYNEGKIKKIIITSILHENEIIDEFLKSGILLNDIISFVSVLYSSDVSI